MSLIFNDENHRGLRTNQASSPRRKLARETDMKRPVNVARAELSRRPRIQNNMSSRLQVLHLSGTERLRLRQFVQQRRALKIDLRIPAEILGRLGKVRRG